MQKKNGRPVSKYPKTEAIGFRCTLAERARLADLSSALGVTIGEYCRIKSLSQKLPKPPVPAINIEKYQELSRLASNLNQLNKSINSGKVNMSTGEILTDILEEVRSLRFELIDL